LGSVLVQAPAGSGKTTLLTQRYLRLLASVDAPERILALTFTRMAAEEMRRRVIGALGAAALAECPPGYNPDTWALAVSARAHLQSLRIDVERQPSRLRIETIDSFNAWLAAQLPIASGAGGRLNLLDDALPSYQEAARRALAHEGTDAFGAAVERTLAVSDQRWRQLVGLIAEMLAGRDRWLALLAGPLGAASALDAAQLERVRRHFDEDLALLVTRQLQGALESLGGEALASLPVLMRDAARRLALERPEWSVWLAGAVPLAADASDLQRWRSMADLFLTRDGRLRKRFNKTQGFPPDCAELKPMNDLLAEFERRPRAARALEGVYGLPEPRYGDDDWVRVRDAAQVLVLAAAELEDVFREQGAVDFPAVSLAALRALGSDQSPTDLGLHLDYRLQHLLLDEFQDTSGAQLELVRMLTSGWQRGDGRSVFCVGDPMQSIYGFRQAEVRAFLELGEIGIGELKFELRRLSSNFRSSPALVHWTNDCFGRIMPRTDDRQRGAIAFRPSISEVEGSGGGQAVTLRGFMSAAAEARAVAELIEARLTVHPEWRTAVLVRARSHARDIAFALRARGIAFRAVDIEPLQDRAVVRDLVMLICALGHLGDRTAWLAVLRAPWAGLTLQDLLVIARAGPIVWDALCDDGVLDGLTADGAARCRRLKRILEDAFRVRNHTGLPRWVERTWLALGGAACTAEERELAHVRAVFSRLRDLGEHGLPDSADLTRRFADLYADGGAESVVEIMTIHKAKGLEFDLVVVPALNRHARQNGSQLLLAHQFARTERDGMVMAARPPVGAEANRLFEFLRAQAKDAAALESQRLLYVACTRAKSELHLYAELVREDPDAVPGETLDEPPDVRPPHPGSLLAVLWPAVSDQFAIEAQSVAASIGATPAIRGGPLRRVPADWSADQVSVAAPGVAPLLSIEDTREETPIFDWVGETARRVGSLVHAELQATNLETHDEAALRARAPHFMRWLALNGVPPERLREATERVVAALTAVHGDPRGRWILKQGYRDDFREHAVSGRWRGEVVRAVFDRSFIDEDGVRWVIDYKTSRHAGGGLEEFLAREVERYRPQLERYAALARRLGPEPVRVGLYFPLIGAWREWNPEG
jgi:ATP-dependent exoDNAse (exonuclease V) beta subunit